MTSSTTADAGQGPPGRRSPRSRIGGPARSRRRRVTVGLLALGLLLVVALLTDAALIASRVDRSPLEARPGPGTTWVVVGLDSRAELPEGTTAAQFGSVDQVPGARADVVIVVHRGPDGTTALSVPRDLVVGSGRDVDRLAVRWLHGPQTVVDDLCRIGIPTDHLVTVDLRGFAAVVDAAGGLDIDVPAPVRDPAAGLELLTAGRLHVDGITALALVRSRHPERLVDGQWVPAPVDPSGRAAAAGTVLSALVAAARPDPLHPVRLQRVAWAASGALTVDDGTSIADLVGLSGLQVGDVPVLPVGEQRGPSLARFATADTKEAIAGAGMSCAG
jgi:LCP family protein required for cell wall assembly